MSKSFTKPVKTILPMVAPVQTITADISLAKVALTMRQHRAACLIIKDEDGNLCGLVSEHDIVQALAISGQEVLQRPVEDFMTMDLICCTEDQSIQEVLIAMSMHRIRHIPVVRNDGHLVGFLSILDILAAMELEIE